MQEPARLTDSCIQRLDALSLSDLPLIEARKYVVRKIAGASNSRSSRSSHACGVRQQLLPRPPMRQEVLFTSIRRSSPPPDLQRAPTDVVHVQFKTRRCHSCGCNIISSRFCIFWDTGLWFVPQNRSNA